MPEAPLLPPELDARPPKRRWVSPLLRRILLVNALPPALLAAALLYLDQYQNGLVAAEVEAMRTQARIYAGAIAEAAVRVQDDRATLVPEQARPLLRRLVEPSPNTQARLFDISGLVIADSRVRESAGGAVVTEPLPAPAARGAISSGVSGAYERLLALLPRRAPNPVVLDATPDAQSFDWQPDLGPERQAELGRALEGGVTPYIRRTPDGRLLVSVAEPAAPRRPAGRHPAADARGARRGRRAAGNPRQRAGAVPAGADPDGGRLALSRAHPGEPDPPARRGGGRDAAGARARRLGAAPPARPQRRDRGAGPRPPGRRPRALGPHRRQ
jgi:hypothetical protein